MSKKAPYDQNKNVNFLLVSARVTIQQLRKRNEIMSARLEMFDTIQAMLNVNMPKENFAMTDEKDICDAIVDYLKANPSPQ